MFKQRSVNFLSLWMKEKGENKVHNIFNYAWIIWSIWLERNKVIFRH